jgi:hypothetical protein
MTSSSTTTGPLLPFAMQRGFQGETVTIHSGDYALHSTVPYRDAQGGLHLYVVLSRNPSESASVTLDDGSVVSVAVNAAPISFVVEQQFLGGLPDVGPEGVSGFFTLRDSAFREVPEYRYVVWPRKPHVTPELVHISALPMGVVRRTAMNDANIRFTSMPESVGCAPIEMGMFKVWLDGPTTLAHRWIANDDGVLHVSTYGEGRGEWSEIRSKGINEYYFEVLDPRTCWGFVDPSLTSISGVVDRRTTGVVEGVASGTVTRTDLVTLENLSKVSGGDGTITTADKLKLADLDKDVYTAPVVINGTRSLPPAAVVVVEKDNTTLYIVIGVSVALLLVAIGITVTVMRAKTQGQSSSPPAQTTQTTPAS